jgi:RibD C-terminal domain
LASQGVRPDLFERVHDELAGDAWLVGRVTGQEFAKGKPYPPSTKKTLPRQLWFARRDAKAYGVVLDSHGKIGWSRSDIGGDPIVVVLSEAVSDAHLAAMQRGGSYIFAEKPELRLALAPDILNRELGVKRLLLERGGGANGAFLRAELVDELNLILCPAVDGARGAPQRLRFHGCGGRLASPRHCDDPWRAAKRWKAAQCYCGIASRTRIPRRPVGSAPVWPDRTQNTSSSSARAAGLMAADNSDVRAEW